MAKKFIKIRLQTNWKGLMDPLTPTTTKLFDTIKKDATKFNVIWNGGEQDEVNGPFGDQCVVDVTREFSTCRRREIICMSCQCMAI
ncbi:hypothetical protein R6Q59_014508 [Mikania micrantha]